MFGRTRALLAGRSIQPPYDARFIPRPNAFAAAYAGTRNTMPLPCCIAAAAANTAFNRKCGDIAALENGAALASPITAANAGTRYSMRVACDVAALYSNAAPLYVANRLLRCYSGTISTAVLAYPSALHGWSIH